MSDVFTIIKATEIQVLNGPLFDAVCKAAGCRGAVFINLQTGLVELRDGSDLVLLSTPLFDDLKPGKKEEGENG